jgi:hypothetical protein
MVEGARAGFLERLAALSVILAELRNYLGGTPTTLEVVAVLALV